MKKLKPENITPQSFESNDGRISIKVDDDGVFELTLTDLDASEKHYYDEEHDWVQKISFSEKDLDRLINILKVAKKINPFSWKTIKDKGLDDKND